MSDETVFVATAEAHISVHADVFGACKAAEDAARPPEKYNPDWYSTGELLLYIDTGGQRAETYGKVSEFKVRNVGTHSEDDTDD